ncbi:PepSY domain-containing protein [Virgibacillus alimentarius]|uniref:Membrane protein YkoI n=1 Tax=Virgibacillus alimentarius TaxID=698769 RepID=A0ABS4S894_9BACI|nr:MULTISPECIES: PepSY domain-containing protein [Virgibacillus]MBP2257717.1 putative membrane protein YkoI [Virgibacillus alimentarius]HLR69289.1 PepSY domain-containing protein [Virgibacillus sp.]
MNNKWQPLRQHPYWQHNLNHQGHINHWYHHPHPNPMPAWNRRVSIEEAMNIALEQVPGQVVKIELEQEHGILVYEVDIITAQGAKYKVEVDVNTGGVVNIELD